MPLNDRDYMKPSPPRRNRAGQGFISNLGLNPMWILIGLNLAIYVATIINHNLLGTMGLSPSWFMTKPWTLVTSMFYHQEFWHFFSNMLMLFFFGRIVFKLMGGWRFTAVYLAGGLAGNLLYLLIGSHNTIAFGASGAVYALAGALVIMVPKLTVNLYFLFPVPLWVFVIIFMVILSVPPFAPSFMAWQAHMGGLVVGVAAGFIFKKQMRYIIYR